MTIKNAIRLLQGFSTETTKKSETRACNDFISILLNLENKGFSPSERELIELALDDLALNNAFATQQIKKALHQFKKFLHTRYSLISRGDYLRFGITIGSLVGLLLGGLFLSGLERSLGISLGITLGTAVGIVVARYLESQAKASGNLI